MAFDDVPIVRMRGDLRSEARDRVVVEAPLEIRLHGRSFAVIMRTPGADRELAAGFLFSERVLKSADDLGTIEYCTDPVRREADATADSAAAENIINVTLAGRTSADVEALVAVRRRTRTNSSCGLCGRRTIESLQVDVERVADSGRVAPAIVSSVPQRLRQMQSVFDETGGLHAAGLFTTDGRLIGCAEDVGRHNAVDKVIGRMIMADALPLRDRLLFVSGRSSFEIVQKALLAGIPIVASVSAPSSLAIELAHETGITLLGFVRGTDFNIYTHAFRISE